MELIVRDRSEARRLATTYTTKPLSVILVRWAAHTSTARLIGVRATLRRARSWAVRRRRLANIYILLTCAISEDTIVATLLTLVVFAFCVGIAIFFAVTETFDADFVIRTCLRRAAHLIDAALLVRDARCQLQTLVRVFNARIVRVTVELSAYFTANKTVFTKAVPDARARFRGFATNNLLLGCKNKIVPPLKLIWFISASDRHPAVPITHRIGMSKRSSGEIELDTDVVDDNRRQVASTARASGRSRALTIPRREERRDPIQTSLLRRRRRGRATRRRPSIGVIGQKLVPRLREKRLDLVPVDGPVITSRTRTRRLRRRRSRARSRRGRRRGEDDECARSERERDEQRGEKARSSAHDACLIVPVDIRRLSGVSQRATGQREGAINKLYGGVLYNRNESSSAIITRTCSVRPGCSPRRLEDDLWPRAPPPAPARPPPDASRPPVSATNRRPIVRPRTRTERWQILHRFWSIIQRRVRRRQP